MIIQTTAVSIPGVTHKKCNGESHRCIFYLKKLNVLIDLRFCFSLVAELSDCNQQVVTIYQGIHYCCHNESSEYIEDGVLFDEHGRQDDRRSQNQGSDADALFLLEALAADDRKMCTQGIIYMNAGPQVGRCVRPVQSGYHAGEDIVSGHYCGTKVLSVGPQSGYDQEDRHACKEENTGAVVILFIFEEKVDDHCRYIGKP